LNFTMATAMAIDNDEEEKIEDKMLLGAIEDVTIHPLVLLSAADHYHRVARGTRKRVVGVLLGAVSRGRVDATNSFAVPFEEDSRNPVSFVVQFCGCRCCRCRLGVTRDFEQCSL
jgi:JAB1/Mov34/MPN/PAD-1 ubiquitin protease